MEKEIKKVKNIEIQSLYKKIKEQEKNNADPYVQTKALCELAGIVSFWRHIGKAEHDDIKKTREMAEYTITTLLKQKSL